MAAKCINCGKRIVWTPELRRYRHAEALRENEIPWNPEAGASAPDANRHASQTGGIPS
jgi:hypothetical protein